MRSMVFKQSWWHFGQWQSHGSHQRARVSLSQKREIKFRPERSPSSSPHSQETNKRLTFLFLREKGIRSAFWTKPLLTTFLSKISHTRQNASSTKIPIFLIPLYHPPLAQCRCLLVFERTTNIEAFLLAYRNSLHDTEQIIPRSVRPSFQRFMLINVEKFFCKSITLMRSLILE